MDRVRIARQDRGECTDSEDEERDTDMKAFKADVAAIRASAASPLGASKAKSLDQVEMPTETAVIKRSIPESRVSEFVAATADHFNSRTFKGLVPTVPEGQSTQIVMGHVGVAKGYQTIGNEGTT
jgi:hypothetical protein